MTARRSGAVLDIDVAPYDFDLHLFTDPRAYVREVNKKRHKADHLTLERVKAAQGMCSKTINSPHEVWVGVFNNSSETLVHELAHAVEYIADRVGLPHGYENHEPKAYLMSYLYRVCTDALNARVT